MGEFEPFVDGIDRLEERQGIVIAVDAPKHSYERLRSIMEQTGAIEIIKD